MTISGAVVAQPLALVVARMPMHGVVLFKDTAQVKLVTGLSKGVPMQEAKQSVAKHFSVVMRDPSTGFGAPLPGSITSGLTVLLKKGGATSYVTIAPTLTAVGGTGLLDLALSAAHLDTLGVAAINITGPGVLPNDDLFIDVVAVDKNDAVRGGMTALPNSAIGTQAGLPTKQNLDDATAAINAHVDAAISGVPSPTDILDALLTDHASVGSVGDAIAITAGLLQGNFFMDTVINDGNGQTSARLRLWRDEGGAGGATGGGSGEGEFATFQVTTTYTAPGKVATHRVVRVVGT